MIVARVNPQEFPQRWGVEAFPYWAKTQLREQGIRFVDDGRVSVSLPTAAEVEKQLLPPWQCWKEMDGTIVVQQGVQG
jgi:hypothetical protein